MEKNEVEFVIISSDSEPETELEKVKRKSDDIEKAMKKSKEDGDDNTTKKSRLISQSSEDGTKSLAKNGENKITGKGRAYTVSIAVAGSIIKRMESLNSKVYVSYRLAMVAKMFNLSEVIVFDDTKALGVADCKQMARLLSFIECPLDIKDAVFGSPLPSDLKLASFVLQSRFGFTNDLTKSQALLYREGVVFSKRMMADGRWHASVNVGLDLHCRVSNDFSEGVGERVTVKFENFDPEHVLKPNTKLKGQVVPKGIPLIENGIYWGYTVRIASSLGKVFSECPFREGYDVKVGTSEKGSDSRLLQPQSYNHLLVVIGGVEGLEYALENDEGLEQNDVSKLFDHYVNTCPSLQGINASERDVMDIFMVSMNALSKWIQK